MIGMLSRKLGKLFSWKEHKLSKVLLEYVQEVYNDLQKQVKVFADAVSNGKHDEDTLKTLEMSYPLIKDDWIRIMNTKRDYARFRNAVFQLNPEEFKRYNSYFKAAFDIYYQCSNDIVDMRIRNGTFDPSKKASFLQAIASQRYSREFFMIK